MSNLHVIDHSLIQEYLAYLRDKKTPPVHFRAILKKIAYFLIYEACRDLPLDDIIIETPIKKTSVKIPDKKIKLIAAPVLRAGLAFSDIIAEIIPEISIQHIGMYRDEKTLKPVWYYDKRKKINKDKEKALVIILDPMLATGNSGKDTIENFILKGIKEENITFMSLIASPEGIENISLAYPDVKIISASLDDGLNQNGYIIPGLGDAGDRIYNTLD